MVPTFVFNVQMCIWTWLFALLLKWPNHLSSKGRSKGRGEDFDWADRVWIYLELWYMDSKMLVRAGMSLQLSRSAGWNADDELMCSYGVIPLLVNSSLGNSCYFLASLQYFTVEPWVLNAGGKSIKHDQPAALPPSPVFPSPPNRFPCSMSWWHSNSSSSILIILEAFCPGFEELS